jgi:hypothetical protein
MKGRQFLLLTGVALVMTILPWGNLPVYGGPGGGIYYANSPVGGATGTAMKNRRES